MLINLCVKRISLTILLFALIFSLTTVYTYTRAGGPTRAYAATSSHLNFQARLLNSTGNTVADGFYNVEFNLYTVSTGGTSEWTETRIGGDKVRVANGYLSVSLGEVTAFPGGINWDQDHWLTMNIGGTGSPAWDGEMTPRLKLTAVPYAFQAKQAEKLTKLDGANTGILDFLALTANRTINLPDADGTLCIQGSEDCVDVVTTGTTATTASNSGLEISADGLRLLGGCSDAQMLRWDGTGEEWVCSSGGGTSFTVRTSDGTTTTTVSSALEFGPASSSTDEFVVAAQGGGVTRITLGSTVLTTNNYTSTLDPVYVNVAEAPAAGDITGSFQAGLTIAANSVALGTDTTGDFVATLGTLTGLSVTGNSGEGSTPALSVLYGSSANTAVQGDQTLVCASGSGNLTGGGNTITLGAGGTCGAISTNNAVTFSTSVTTPLITNAGQLDFSSTATAGADDIVFTSAGSESLRILENGDFKFERGTNDAFFTVAVPSGAPATYTFSGATGTVLTTANFSGSLDGIYVNEGQSPAAGDISGSFSGGLLVNSVQNNSVDLGTDTVGDFVATITAGGGLTGTATGEGSTPTLAIGAGNGITVNADDIAVVYGSAANTAVQGSTTLVCPTGTGDLSGGGNTITLGAGGTCSNITISEAPVFDTSVTTPLLTYAGALTLQTTATGGADDLIFKTAGSEAMRLLENGNLFFERGTDDATIVVATPSGAPATYTFSGATGTVLTSANFTGTLDGIYVNEGQSPSAGDVSGSFTAGLSVNSVQNNSVDLTTDTVGNYVASITAAGGLTGDIASEGGAASLAIGAGNGITVNADDVAVNQDYSFAWTAAQTWNLSETEGLAVNSSVSGTNSSTAQTITVTNSSTSGTQRGLLVANAASTGTTDALFVLDNADTDTVVTAAIQILNTTRFTNIFDIGGVGISATEFTVLDGGIDEGEVAGVVTEVTAGSGLTGGGTAGAVTLNIGAGNGITVNGDDIAVIYGSGANTAVQGNTQLTCASGAGNLTGGGTVITLGTGGTCANITTNNDVSFTTAVRTPLVTNAGPLTVSTTGSNALTLTSGSGLINLGATQLATTGSLGFDLVNAATSVLSIENSGAGVANLELVDGNLIVGGQTVLTSGRVLQNLAGLTVSSGGATIVGDLSVDGNIFDPTGNLVLNDTTDIGSAATGLRIATDGSLLDIDGALVLNDELNLGSATTGLFITTDGVITDLDDTSISFGEGISVTGNSTVTGTFGTYGSGYNFFATSSALNAYGYFRSVDTSDAVSHFEIGAYDINGGSQGGRSLVLNPLGGNVGVGGDLTPDGLFSVGSTSSFQVTNAGAVTAVGIDSGTGLIQGTGGLTIAGAISLDGALSDPTGNLVLDDTTDIGSATTGLRVGTDGSLLDIDGILVLDDQLRLGSNTTGLDITTDGVITDVDDVSISFGEAIVVSGSAQFGDASNYGLFSATGDLQLFGTADYLVGADRFAFRYALDQNYGLLFNSTSGRYDFTTGTGSAVFTISAADGSLTTNGDLALNGGDITSTGAISIISANATSLTLDSGTTGAVNLGTGNSAKTINIGTGTAGNTINIGTNNTTADTIAIGSASDALTITGSNTTTFVLNGITVDDAEFNLLDGKDAALVDQNDFITTDGAGATTNGSGLEAGTGGIGLLQGCANNQILKWVDGTSRWNCAADNTGLSDSRVKTNVATIDGNFLDKIKDIRLVEFDYICESPAFDTQHCDTDHQAGVIAQELAVLFPELVFEDANGYLNVRYDMLGFYNLKAVSRLATMLSHNGDAWLNNVSTGNTLRLTSTGQLENITGLNIVSGGASIVGGINNNSGGITNAGAITGVTSITGAGAISGITSITGDGAGTIDFTNFDVASTGAVTLTGNLQLSGDAGEGVSGGGLVDCDGGNSRLTWDASTNKFGCNTMTTRSYLDDTADTVMDNNTTSYWDLSATNGNQYPNLTLSDSANEVFGMVSMEVTQTSGSGDVETVATIRRTTDGSVPTCASPQIGPNIGVFTTTTNAQAGTSVAFIDAPNTIANPSRYIICSDSATNIPGGLGGNVSQITRLRVTLFEVNNAADLAEIYPTTDDSIKAAEVVSLDPNGRVSVNRSVRPYDNTAIGVVATNPALLMGGTDGEAANGVPVALAGRVPVKVSAHNGAIKKGDLLTSSEIPGVAMKATKAGATIGMAMADYSGEGVGSVMMFIQTGQSGGVVDSTKPSRQLLEDMVAARSDIINSEFKMSQLNADVITAGLELITPKVTAGIIDTDSFVVNDAGLIFKNNEEQTVATIARDGVATLNGLQVSGDINVDGVLEVGTLRVKNVEGLDYQGRIDDLENQLATVEDRLAAVEQNQSQNINLSDLSVGKLTASGDTSLQGLTVNLDLVAKGSMIVEGQATFKEAVRFEKNVLLDGEINVLGYANMQGLTVNLDLIVRGAMIIDGKATFKEAVRFEKDVVFEKDVAVKGQATFNKDTAGYVTIKQGEATAKVTFTTAKARKPVIALTLGEGKFAQYSYRNVTEEGFEIILLTPATEDLSFSWVAIQTESEL